MPLVMSYHDIGPSGFQRDDNRGPDHPANEAVTFFRPASNQPHYPNAFLVRMFSQGGAHYHGADEFQVVVDQTKARLRPRNYGLLTTRVKTNDYFAN